MNYLTEAYEASLDNERFMARENPWAWGYPLPGKPREIRCDLCDDIGGRPLSDGSWQVCPRCKGK